MITKFPHPKPDPNAAQIALAVQLGFLPHAEALKKTWAKPGPKQQVLAL